MNVDKMFQSKYLKQSDLDGEQTVTIQKVGQANMAREGDDPEYKWLIRFNEFDKPMVLNSTNIKRLARACNSQETDDWAGKRVVLYVDPDVEYGGNVVGGLRIKSAQKQAPQPRKVPGNGNGPMGDMESDIPFR